MTSHLLLNPKDQIVYLTKKTLNLIRQVINATIIKKFD